MSGWVILALIAWTVAVFVAGFFVGKKHGIRVEQAERTLKDLVGKL